MKLLLLLIVLISLTSQAQSDDDPWEKAGNIFKRITLSIDTAIGVTRAGIHGERDTLLTRIRLSFDSFRNLVFAEELFDTKGRFNQYYFDKGRLILRLWNDEATGDINERTYPNGIGYSPDASVAIAILDFVKNYKL